MGLEKKLFMDAASASAFSCAVCNHIECAHSSTSLTPTTTSTSPHTTHNNSMSGSGGSSAEGGGVVSRGRECPHDGEALGTSPLLSLSSSPIVLRTYNALSVRCRHSGCTWTGSLSELHTHLEEDCDEAGIPCQHDGCPYICPRRDMIQMPTHSAQCPHALVACPYCEVGIKQMLLSEHVEGICPLAPVPCPNSSECTAHVVRSMLQQHLRDTCLYRIVSCVYEDVGCHHTGEYIHMADHDTDPAVMHMHLALAHRKIRALTTAVDNLTQQQDSHSRVQEENLKGSFCDIMQQQDHIRKTHEEHISVVIQQQRHIRDNIARTETLNRQVDTLSQELRVIKMRRRESPVYYIQALVIFMILGLVLYGQCSLDCVKNTK